jgi:curved DNA-binding protein CbpA
LTQDHLPNLIHSLSEYEESGILHLSRPQVSKRIYFGQGSMVFANSDQRADRLGEFLVRNGKMTHSHLELASERVKCSGHRLGETFVDMGLMTETEMEVRVAEQILEIIYSLFTWDAGEYRFRQHPNPIAQDIALKLPTVPVILEGVRHMNDPAAVRRALGDLNRVVSYSRDPSLPHGINLTSEESFVLSRVDGQCTLSNILSVSPLSEDETLRCLYGLFSAGFLELGNKGHQLTPKKKRLPLFPEEHRPSGRSKNRSEAKTLNLSAEERWIREDILTKHSSLATGSYYDWLELRKTAKGEEVKKSYFAMIKRYHPDRFNSANLRDLRGHLEELFSKITDAYQILSNPISKRRYDNSLRTEAPRGEDLSPRAFLTRPPDEESAATSMEKLAERYYREAKRHFSKKDFHRTVELLKEALRLDSSKGAYHKLLARALAMNPKWRKDAVEHFETALEICPFDVECLVGLGEIYEKSGLIGRASRMFSRALELDPENADILDELAGQSGTKGLSRLWSHKTEM